MKEVALGKRQLLRVSILWIIVVEGFDNLFRRQCNGGFWGDRDVLLFLLFVAFERPADCLEYMLGHGLHG